VELDAAGDDADPPFEHLTRRWGFFYVDTLGRWLGEVTEALERASTASQLRR
jgi:hypothetical protein